MHATARGHHGHHHHARGATHRIGYRQSHQLHRSISDLEDHPLHVHLHLPALTSPPGATSVSASCAVPSASCHEALLYSVFITKRRAASRNVTKQWPRMIYLSDRRMVTGTSSPPVSLTVCTRGSALGRALVWGRIYLLLISGIIIGRQMNMRT